MPTRIPIVYGLYDPRTGACRYVGRSVRPRSRLRQHVVNAHSGVLRAWVAELQALGLEPMMAVMESGTEDEWITKLKPDLNTYAGADDDRKGFLCRLTAEDREKLKLIQQHTGARTLSEAVRLAVEAWNPRRRS